jgi:hypothetical protein
MFILSTFAMSGACRRLWMQETVVNRFSSVFLLLTRSPTWLLVLALRNTNVGLKICCWFLFYRPCCSQLGNPSLLVRRRDRNSHGIDVVVFLCYLRMYKQATVTSCSYGQQVETMIPSFCTQWYIFICNSESELRYGCMDESLPCCLGIQHNGSSLR